MDLVWTIVMGVGGVLGAMFAGIAIHLTADELKAWAPRIADRIIECAVSYLASSQRDRYREEWCSHVHDTPGDLGKILVAFGVLVAGYRMRAHTLRVPTWRRLFRSLQHEREFIAECAWIMSGGSDSPEHVLRSKKFKAAFQATVSRRDLLRIRRAALDLGNTGPNSLGRVTGQVVVDGLREMKLVTRQPSDQG